MKLKIACLLLLLPVLLPAEKLEWSGYFEPQYAGMQVNGQFFNLSSNKLRVDLKKDLSERVSFKGNFDYITYHGKTEWNILDYLPDHITQSIPSAMASMFTLNFGDMVQKVGPMTASRPDRIFLDNANLRLSFKRFDLTVGKQQLSMGTGYTWNPTDLFNTRDILDPTYEQPGHNAIRIDVPLSPACHFTACYVPGEKWKDSARMLKLKSRLGHFDLSVLGIQRIWNLTDYNSFQTGVYDRKLVGGDLTGELLGLGVWAEGGYNIVHWHNNSTIIPAVKDHWEMVWGADYTFSSGLYIMAEYYHNSMAPNNWQRYSLNSWMWMFSGEMKTLCRNQVSTLLQYPLTDFITAGSSLIASAGDGSVAFVPMVLYSVFQDVDLTVFGNIYLGREGRAYNSKMGNGGLARLRVYF